MKKLMFALVCAASVAVFAEGELSGGVVGFEGYNVPFSGLSGMDDTGSSAGDLYWLYMGATADSTADASTVKAYGAEGNLEKPSWGAQKSGTPGNNYLELSTEGGTLWRSINTLDTTGTAAALGATKTIGTSLYIDTMVQFSPTEDTTTPTLTENTDKLAIWLNVDTASNTTNLMVYANQMGDDDGAGVPQTAAKAFTLVKEDGSALQIDAGAWYRLTVKALGNVLEMEGFSLDCFTIYLDGVALKAVEESFTEGALGILGEFLKPGVTLDGHSVFASLKGIGNAEAGVDGVLQAVGFQGTGAIDALVLTETSPFAELPTSADFTLTWGEGVSAVWYTIGNGEKTAATSGTKVTCDAGAVVKIEATAADWYVLDAASVADLTVETADTTRAITATKVEPATITTETTAASIGITDGAFAGKAGEALQAPVAWAQENNLKPADLSAMTFTAGATWTTAEKAYLFNIAPTEEAVVAAEEAFKITKIEQDADGNWVVTGPDATSFNGEVKIKGKANLGDADWADKDDGHKFFKAFLELK